MEGKVPTIVPVKDPDPVQSKHGEIHPTPTADRWIWRRCSGFDDIAGKNWQDQP